MMSKDVLPSGTTPCSTVTIHEEYRLQLTHAALHLDQFLNAIITQYGMAIYAVLFVIVVCETAVLVLFFLPGDPLIFISGALCATGAINFWITAALICLAGIIGSNINYWLGNTLGKKIALNDYPWLNRSSLNSAHIFYEKHGAVTFIVSLFIPVIRTFAPFIAGLSNMTYRKFQLFSTAGAALWTITLISAGYFFGNIPVIRDHLNMIVLLGVGLGVAIPLLSGGLRYIKKRQL
ncbi:VTT domain-containing protein [Methylovorus sp. MM2]|uniref:VTT domain-containing protein n=1 Tax=Methylovorus sp. MM2 TaxID=1848038 RepID=UPI001C263A10|nr:VTT domain-containing protein [Methylovorus sp. MM2]